MTSLPHPSTATAPDPLEQSSVLVAADGQPPHEHLHRSEATALGCRDRAAASLVAASAMDTANGRSRQEASAATWAARADMIDKLEQRQHARELASAAGLLDPEPRK